MKVEDVIVGEDECAVFADGGALVPGLRWVLGRRELLRGLVATEVFEVDSR